MNITLPNQIVINVSQSPAAPLPGDTVVFSTQTILENAIDYEYSDNLNYFYSYNWLVSRDNGLSFVSAGPDLDTLTIENISQSFFGEIYKLEVTLIDLSNMLLTEDGDVLTSHRGEVLLSDTASLLSIQNEDPVPEPNSHAVDIANKSAPTEQALDLLDVVSNTNELAEFDPLIDEETADIINSAQGISARESVSQNISNNPIEVFVDDFIDESELVLEPPFPQNNISISAYDLTQQQLDIGCDTRLSYKTCNSRGWFSGQYSLEECKDLGGCTDDSLLVVVDLNPPQPGPTMFSHVIKLSDEKIQGFCCAYNSNMIYSSAPLECDSNQAVPSNGKRSGYSGNNPDGEVTITVVYRDEKTGNEISRETKKQKRGSRPYFEWTGGENDNYTPRGYDIDETLANIIDNDKLKSFIRENLRYVARESVTSVGYIKGLGPTAGGDGWFRTQNLPYGLLNDCACSKNNNVEVEAQLATIDATLTRPDNSVGNNVIDGINCVVVTSLLATGNGPAAVGGAALASALSLLKSTNTTALNETIKIYTCKDGFTPHVFECIDSYVADESTLKVVEPNVVRTISGNNILSTQQPTIKNITLSPEDLYDCRCTPNKAGSGTISVPPPKFRRSDKSTSDSCVYEAIQAYAYLNSKCRCEPRAAYQGLNPQQLLEKGIFSDIPIITYEVGGEKSQWLCRSDPNNPELDNVCLFFIEQGQYRDIIKPNTNKCSSVKCEGSLCEEPGMEYFVRYGKSETISCADNTKELTIPLEPQLNIVQVSTAPDVKEITVQPQDDIINANGQNIISKIVYGCNKAESTNNITIDILHIFEVPIECSRRFLATRYSSRDEAIKRQGLDPSHIHIILDYGPKTSKNRTSILEGDDRIQSYYDLEYKKIDVIYPQDDCKKYCTTWYTLDKAKVALYPCNDASYSVNCGTHTVSSPGRCNNKNSTSFSENINKIVITKVINPTSELIDTIIRDQSQDKPNYFDSVDKALAAAEEIIKSSSSGAGIICTDW